MVLVPLITTGTTVMGTTVMGTTVMGTTASVVPALVVMYCWLAEVGVFVYGGWLCDVGLGCVGGLEELSECEPRECEPPAWEADDDDA